MLGNNPIRQPVFNSGAALEIKEIYRSLQGEGPNAGIPAIFVRLGGCNLACGFCDTDFEDFSSMLLPAIIDEVQAVNERKNIGLVVITGGEPLRQPIESLCRLLLERGYRVQIETNGTIFRDLDRRVEIVCSPKNTGGGYFPVRGDLMERLQALKFLISAHNPLYGEIPEIGQGKYGIPVYIQPMDELDEGKNSSNRRLAAEIAIKGGYRLSLQLHKMLGMR